VTTVWNKRISIMVSWVDINLPMIQAASILFPLTKYRRREPIETIITAKLNYMPRNWILRSH